MNSLDIMTFLRHVTKFKKKLVSKIMEKERGSRRGPRGRGKRERITVFSLILFYFIYGLTV